MAKSNAKTKKTKKTKKTTGKAPAKKTEKKVESKKTPKKATSSRTTTPRKTTTPKKADKKKATTPKKPNLKAPTKNTARKTAGKSTVNGKHIQKVYKNEEGKVIYRETTDRVGDVLVNGAGVKFKITGERRAKPTGYDDGKLKVRVLTISQGKHKMEFVDTTLKHYRYNKVLRRVSK